MTEENKTTGSKDLYFCEDCGNIKNRDSGVFICNACSKSSAILPSQSKIYVSNITAVSKAAINDTIHRFQFDVTNPRININCPKCGFNNVRYILRGAEKKIIFGCVQEDCANVWLKE